MPNSSQLEPDYAPAFQAWKDKPGPETVTGLLTVIHPVIETAVGRYGSKDPLGLARGRRMLVDSLPRYDPAKGSLGAFAETQLRGLARVTARASAGVKVPDRVAGDRLRLGEATTELEHELGRAPTTDELADRSGFGPSRIRKIRTYQPAVSASAFRGSDGDDFAGVSPHGEIGKSWVTAVYEDSSPAEQAVLEHTLGLFGTKKLDTDRLAAKLGVSAGRISQIKDKLQQRIDDGPWLLARAGG